MAITVVRSVWTKPALLEQIGLYQEALKALAFGKSYTIGSRQLTRLDIDDILKLLDYLKNELAAIDNGSGPKMVHGVARRGCCCGRLRRW